MTASKSERIKILVVEDEELVRTVAAGHLTQSGFEVSEAADAAEALRLAVSAGKFDVLFTDVRLPGQIDGLELAARLKREGRCQIVIYATGYAYDPPRMVSPSFALRKPYMMESVIGAIQALRDVIQSESAAESNPAGRAPDHGAVQGFPGDPG